MKCNKGKLCNNFILSTSVTASDTNLVVNIPALPCYNGCMVIAQALPTTSTIDLPVVVTIGSGTVQYPLVDACGVQLSAGRLDVRRRYEFKFISANTQSVFKICNNVRCMYNSIPGVIS